MEPVAAPEVKQPTEVKQETEIKKEGAPEGGPLDELDNDALFERLSQLDWTSGSFVPVCSLFNSCSFVARINRKLGNDGLSSMEITKGFIIEYVFYNHILC